MENIKSLPNLWEHYQSFKNELFSKRYLSLEKIEQVLKQLPSSFLLKTEGYSRDHRAIHSVSFGEGKTKILMWSQMHGNEATTTKAVFDLFKTFELIGEKSFLKEISLNCTIKIIPVLNPDGAQAYTRQNANKVDLNRDAKDLSQPESKLLSAVFDDFNPDFCFNLHDQRSIYSAGNFNRSAVVSFLSPSFNQEKSINTTREISMKLIAQMNTGLQEYIPEQVGRYDDGFNPNCVGDKFQSLGVPTILFEAGHFPGDYQREKTRKLIYIALMKSLISISKGAYNLIDPQEYHDIPENKKLFLDIIIRNISLNDEILDVGIQYEERLDDQEIKFIPILTEIGNLSHLYGHREIEGKNQLLAINEKDCIEKNVEIKEITIGNENIMLNLIQY